jgi:hypothetical protein
VKHFSLFFTVVWFTGTSITGVAREHIVASNSSKTHRNDIYIAIRGDGLSGGGTMSDPYDGSTSDKFDSIMDGLPINTRVSLAPGSIFFTNGLKWHDNSKGWTVKSGLHLLGNGSTVKLAVLPDDWPNVHFQKHIVMGNQVLDPPANNVTIENLTIDANWQNLASPQTNKALICAFLVGSNNSYRKVRAINAYGDSASKTECFTLGFNAAAGGASNCWAYDCVIDTPRGDYQAGIAFFGYSKTNPLKRSGAVNCQALARCESGLINLAYNDGLTVTGCYTYDSQGIHHDTGTLRHLVVKKNTFEHIFGTGVQSQATGEDASDFVISENYFQITNQVNGGHSYGVTTDARNTVITKNVFVKDESGSGYAGWRAIYSTNANGMTITDNSGDNTMEYYVKGRNISARNNRDFNGHVLPSLQRP